MSKKHHQRTRAEILAKRAQPISKWAGWTRGVPVVIRTQPVEYRSKYTPHIGAKERERAKRCYMSPTFNCDGHIRAAPVMHQISKVARVADTELWQQEYESVF